MMFLEILACILHGSRATAALVASQISNRELSLKVRGPNPEVAENVRATCGALV